MIFQSKFKIPLSMIEITFLLLEKWLGDTTKGIMKGNSLLAYFPFHLGADQRSGGLVSWINSWWTGKTPLIHLSPNGWFDNVFVEGNVLWTPPPQQKLKQRLSSCVEITIYGKRACMLFAYFVWWLICGGSTYQRWRILFKLCLLMRRCGLRAIMKN